MSACGTVERGLLEALRGTASEAVCLEIEAHLIDCAACRETRRAFGLLGALRSMPAATLGPAAESRVIRELVAERRPGPPLVERRPGRARLALAGAGVVLLAAAVTAAGIGLDWRGAGGHSASQGAPASSAAPLGAVASAVTEGARIEAVEPGVIAFAGSGVTYQPGAAMAFFPSARTLKLEKGQIDVDVTEHRATHFRVVTARFIVDVLGTRFVVTPDGVRTLRGLVRVLDPEGHTVTDLPAGAAWTAPPVSPAPAEVTPAAPAPVTESAAIAPAAGARPGPTSSRSGDVAGLVARARAALVSGDSPRARSLLERALAAHPGRTARPAIELLVADAWLVARRPDEALAAYRAVMQRHAGVSEGETAAFAVCQLLLERGATAEARAALDAYLGRYPHGRFVREVRERLGQLAPGR